VQLMVILSWVPRETSVNRRNAGLSAYLLAAMFYRSQRYSRTAPIAAKPQKIRAGHRSPAGDVRQGGV
jgi:hypothetical protein